MTPSAYQETIFSDVRDGQGHTCVDAVAGSGKTTTLVEAAKLLPQGTHATFLAFNKHIAEALNARFKQADARLEARTIHSLAMRLVSDAVEPRLDVKAQKYAWMSKDYLSEPDNQVLCSLYPDARAAQIALTELIDFARLTLSDPKDVNAFQARADQWGIECQPGYATACADLLKRGALRAQKTGVIDFTDMIYLPHRWDLKPAEPFDWLLCDEVQDFSAAQRELILRHADPQTRGLWVGDANQAIMGFAYAEYDSWSQVRDRLDAKVLPLSICYRCPPNHLELARRLVPQIEAVPGRPDGELRHIEADQVVGLAQQGDLIICRRTAPLIKLAAPLIRKGLGARIRGRDFAGSISNHLKNLARGGHNLPKVQLAKYNQEWLCNQMALLEARSAPAAAIERVSAKAEIAEAIMDAAPGNDLDSCLSYTQMLFADEGAGLWLSSIHRAKGMEADHVIVLEADKLGQGFARQSESELQQERNLRYVGLTRAKHSMLLARAEERKTED